MTDISRNLMCSIHFR